ncbi:hypothetical protein HMPREF1983_00108 [Gemella bergeri ATCC 700627]|uniref:Uncharacterized protein n=1 Tax=Gemella bergeri ATCC 700627 TaxID=1321820 RepID=U2QVF4_9BACL|nr:hypothetical protein HMPREF1983_00108 [Gemella bergeri ATCC 700627]
MIKIYYKKFVVYIFLLKKYKISKMLENTRKEIILKKYDGKKYDKV